MELAENKYKLLVENNQWNSPNEDQQKIIALAAQVKSLKKTSTKRSTLNSTSKPKERKDKNSSSTTSESKNRSTTGRDKSKNRSDPPAWKLKAPKAGEPKSKTIEGKKYHWCPYHQMWTLHKPEDCKKKPTTTGTPSLEVRRALTAVMEVNPNL